MVYSSRNLKPDVWSKELAGFSLLKFHAESRVKKRLLPFTDCRSSAKDGRYFLPLLLVWNTNKEEQENYFDFAINSKFKGQ